MAVMLIGARSYLAQKTAGQAGELEAVLGAALAQREVTRGE